MKHFLFILDKSLQESIKDDPILKKHVSTLVSYGKGMIVRFKDDTKDDISSYLMLKYGDYIKDFDHIVPDRTPKPGVDYIIKRKNV